MIKQRKIPGLFFTGTDTEVGKTFVMAAVARILRRQKREVRVCKPIATGASLLSGRWINSDTLALAKAAEVGDDLDSVTPWTFADPVAPSVAARKDGFPLNIGEIAERVRCLAGTGEFMLVEGVGGLLCPLGEKQTVADLVKILGLPLVVVARRALGTLNHTLLTLEVARSRGLAVAGVVVNEARRPNSLAEATNVEELRRQTDTPILAVVPFQDDPAKGDIPELEKVDWWKLG